MTHASRRRETRRRRRFRRARALLAGGLVFGAGAAATLAAWTDGENATASVAAGVFATESRGAGDAGYRGNDTAPGAALSFSSAATMSPGSSHYAWLDIRTTPTSTVGGTVTLASLTAAPAGAASDLRPVLEYRMVRAASPAAVCDASAFTGSPVYLVGGPSAYAAVSAAVPSTRVATTLAAAGGQARFCVDVRIQSTAPNSYQGMGATLTWRFDAMSAQ